MSGNGKSVVHLEIEDEKGVTDMRMGGTVKTLLYGVCVILREICKEAGLDRRSAWEWIGRAMDRAEAKMAEDGEDTPRLRVLKGEDDA